MSEPGHWFEREPQWFKTAVFYEIHLRGFNDGNDDGSGDFRGLADKLDYLQEIGVDCIWLLPFCATAATTSRTSTTSIPTTGRSTTSSTSSTRRTSAGCA